MASSKELQSRPLTQHRPSAPPNHQPGLPTRQSHSRNGSHSLAGSLNATHRVTRRKSMSNTGANAAAIAAALKEAGEAGDQISALPMAINSRRNALAKGIRGGAATGSLPSPPSSLPTSRFLADGKTAAPDTSAIDDEQMSSDESPTTFQKARVRRASDGQPLVKEGRKSNRVELRCEKCGKGYKHSSCLTKHLWEHTPEWSYTSKLLISKHQQVQLLEAASVLVAMNNRVHEAATPPDSAKDFPSDRESASPTASGYSDLREERSSADTTPPPQSEVFDSTYRSVSKRAVSGGSLSRPFQPGPNSMMITGSAPHGSGFRHYRQFSHDQRPLSSGKNATGKDDSDLAATLGMLSCSAGSNASRNFSLPADAPPVPPVPAQYLDQLALSDTSPFMTMGSFLARQPESFARGEYPSEQVKMEDSDDEFDVRSRARSDDDDDGVFGRMEE